MGLIRCNGGGRLLPSIGALLYLMVGLATGNVVLIGRNGSKSFDDIEANFTPTIRSSGEGGVLYLAEPLDACTPLMNNVVEGSKSPFALIIRGGCPFDDKVRSAQNAGFKAAIVYNNEDGGLVAMAGTPEGIKIHAVFVSKASGMVLKKYAGHLDMELWIIPSFESSVWSIMALSFISLLAMSAVLATCFFVRRQHVRRERPRTSQVREYHGMSSRLVKAMPSLIFTAVLEDNCTSRTCAICLEDYSVGEKLRVLPCHHKFHAICIDSWLTTWRTFCPVCKQDARTSLGNCSASESTPLLSSGAASASPTAGSASQRSSVGTSLAMPMVPTPPWLPLPSQIHCLSGTPHMVSSCKSYNNLHDMCITRSSVDLRNLSSHRTHGSPLISPHSLGFPLYSPSKSRYHCPSIPTSSNASPSYLVRSSSQHSYLLHCQSGASILALASAPSLPGC